jgi:putative NADH-flavin reductase
MKIAVIGASGWMGGTIAREALSRGHKVTAIARDTSKLDGLGAAAAVSTDVTRREQIASAVAGHEVVVAAVTDRSRPEALRLIPTTARMLLGVLPQAGVGRLAFMGGGGSLESAPGVRYVDEPGFPPEYKPEALAQAEALDILRGSCGAVEWTYISPPPVEFVSGEKTGTYRVQAGDTPVTDETGKSRITSGDLAAALVDEIERPRFTGERFTVGY